MQWSSGSIAYTNYKFGNWSLLYLFQKVLQDLKPRIYKFGFIYYCESNISVIAVIESYQPIRNGNVIVLFCKPDYHCNQMIVSNWRISLFICHICCSFIYVLTTKNVLLKVDIIFTSYSKLLLENQDRQITVQTQLFKYSYNKLK